MSDLPDTVLDVFVPAEGSLLANLVRPGSAIVGRRTFPDVDRVLIDYEGNLYGAANIQTYMDKVIHAAGRHLVRYPTTARQFVQPSELVKVGTYQYLGGDHHFDITDQKALDRWTQ